MYRVRSARSTQTQETKEIIRRAKKNIDAGMDWREAIKEANAIEDTIQREKATKAIIDYI
jgi:hypothetical protein